MNGSNLQLNYTKEFQNLRILEAKTEQNLHTLMNNNNKYNIFYNHY
jgi:hypothetical protein